MKFEVDPPIIEMPPDIQPVPLPRVIRPGDAGWPGNADNPAQTMPPDLQPVPLPPVIRPGEGARPGSIENPVQPLPLDITPESPITNWPRFEPAGGIQRIGHGPVVAYGAAPAVVPSAPTPGAPAAPGAPGAGSGGSSSGVRYSMDTSGIHATLVDVAADSESLLRAAQDTRAGGDLVSDNFGTADVVSAAFTRFWAARDDVGERVASLIFRKAEAVSTAAFAFVEADADMASNALAKLPTGYEPPRASGPQMY